MPAHRSVFDVFLLGSCRILLFFSHRNYISRYACKVRDFFTQRLNYELDGGAIKPCTITLLCKQGQLQEARKLFGRMPDPDAVSWTSLIAGYAKWGSMEEARRLFDRRDAKKNVVTWTAMINGYVKKGKISDAEKLFEEMPEKNVITWNTMIQGFVKSGNVQNALQLFEKMEERNVVSWNTILAGLLGHRMMDEAMGTFDQMPVRNIISWTTMVSGLSSNGRVNEARILFEKMPVRNVVSWNAMITGYTKNLRLKEAFDLFEIMPERDASSWNTMIAGCVLCGDMRRATMLFNRMPEKNVVSWTAIIDGLVQNNENEEAMVMFLDMHADPTVKPNERTFVCVLGACSGLAGIAEGKQIHQVISKTPCQNSYFVISAILSMYSKCGELQTAKKIFDDHLTRNKDLVCFNSMIAAYAFHGCGREAIKLFEQISVQGIRPDEVTYIGLISACSHAGLVDEGLKYFVMLMNDKSIKFREDHFTTLIDVFGRANRLEEALELIQHHRADASVFTLGTLAAGFNYHRHAGLEKQVAEMLIKSEPENAGFYTLLSNICAGNRQWQEAARLRMIVKEKGLKKQPGCSWIQVGNRVLVFVVGDKSHLDSEPIQNVLDALILEMKSPANSIMEKVGFGIGTE